MQKDEAKHVQENVDNHQLLMLKDERITRKKECDKYDTELNRWDRKAAAIAKNINSLLVTCTEEQKLPLQSICCLLDESDWWNFIISTHNKVLRIQKEQWCVV